MRSTTIGALRAHLVLLSAATGVVSAAAVVLVALLHLPADHSGPEARASMFGAALLLTLYLWKRAWQAFRAALRTDQVALSTVTRNGVAITERCPDAWLVQLYVELFPSLSHSALTRKSTGTSCRETRGLRHEAWKLFQQIESKRR
ncbi:hypothetical protein [Caballeronia sp.]|uniref:hypothetical protein n=1 Tax=Caballeronia sp. TaxID=1931223 RepID=UPI003C645A94